ncbi:MAG TPA: hypothetical protein VGS19_20145 [Streptosporangiaceae bacterium]|nr:hypothetical protein [Streptosporangiaceae bacterium]
MNTENEREVRAWLGTALDEFTPGPLPFETVVKRGKGMRVKRRLIAVAAVTAVAALGVPFVVHQFGAGESAPVVSSHYYVTDNPPGPGSARGLIASGTLNGKHWQAVGQFAPGMGCGFSFQTSQGSTCVQGQVGGGDPATVILTMGQVSVGSVRGDVAYLHLLLTNGRTLTVHPVPVFGGRYARYFAFAVPTSAAVTKVVAYSSDQHELGYAIPFTALGSVETVRWLHRGETVPPRATYRIGSGAVAGQGWAVDAYVGPWGVCLGLPRSGGGGCYPSLSHWLGKTRPVKQAFSAAALGNSVVTALVVAGDVDHVVVQQPNGHTSVRAVPAGGARFCVFVTGQDEHASWAAYSASGAILAHGTVLGSSSVTSLG